MDVRHVTIKCMADILKSSPHCNKLDGRACWKVGMTAWSVLFPIFNGKGVWHCVWDALSINEQK